MHSTTPQIIKALNVKAQELLVAKYGVDSVLKTFVIHIEQGNLSLLDLFPILRITVDEQREFKECLFSWGLPPCNLGSDKKEESNYAIYNFEECIYYGFCAITNKPNEYTDRISMAIDWLEDAMTSTKSAYIKFAPIDLTITKENHKELGFVWVGDTDEGNIPKLKMLGGLLFGEPHAEDTAKIGVYTPARQTEEEAINELNRTATITGMTNNQTLEKLQTQED